MGWYDQITYISKLPIMILPNYYVANKKWFRKLPAEIQRAIKESALASAEYTIKILAEKEAETVKEFETEYGIEVIQLSEMEKEPFRKATQVVLDEFSNRYPWATKFFSDIKSVR
jgi:TRAP-type C4-dicarboxylate transport system substrate-binding protein